MEYITQYILLANTSSGLGVPEDISQRRNYETKKNKTKKRG